MKRAYQTPSVELEQLASTTIVMTSPNINLNQDPVNNIEGD